MSELKDPPRDPLNYRMTIPIVLAFVACMLSVYLLGQHVYRYGSASYAEPVDVLSETPEEAQEAPAVAALVSGSHAE